VTALDSPNVPASNPPPQTVPVAPKVRPDPAGGFSVELISVGDDLLRGGVEDANAPFFADQLSARGAVVHRIAIVADDENTVRDAVREALGRNPHLLVISGGLGPAADDHTLAGVAAALERPLAQHSGTRSLVEASYARLRHARVVNSAALTQARERLCRLPVGAEPIPNESGVTPGVLVRLAGGSAVLCLPGGAGENRAMFEAALVLLKEALPRAVTAHRKIEAPTADEAELRELVDMLAEEFDGARISTRPPRTYRKGAVATIVVEATAPTAEEANGLVGLVQRRLLAIAGGGA